ncbi:MAG TPA: imidazole glycerol phosphate synthase subunit HisH [Kiritimatiellia bacterium]|nr:imidazole glycerol phosphate synthase subunit HisH [Kiritimatiellia bacterium]
MTIGIIDYGMGNLGSVSNACRFLSLPARILTAPDELDACDALILPGVGAFGDCMRHLTEHGFTEPVRAWIAADRPFLGICLGLQVLFEAGEESPGVPGLGVFPGVVRRFQTPSSLKVPQIGWNRVRQCPSGRALFAGIPDGTHFYFVHSYYVDGADTSLIAGVTDYGITYTSAVACGRVMAVQFHPEKSQQAGLSLLRNFHDIATAAKAVPV